MRQLKHKDTRPLSICQRMFNLVPFDFILFTWFHYGV